VRGVCALRPGVPGVSENIRVRSIVGRFLEHSRAFYFENGGQAEIYCASADWMERNFFRRVEVAFPIQRPSHRTRVLEDLTRYLEDDTQAWFLKPDGRYERLSADGERPRSAQAELLANYAAGPAFTPVPPDDDDPP
jgi:polyphosphate kinase